MKIVKAALKKYVSYSSNRQNIIKLVTGTLGSQFITLLAAPLLSRLYNPESFGLLASYASILAILNVISSLRYELAIAVPDNQEDSILLVWLCFSLVCISTSITFIVVLFFGDFIAVTLHQPSLRSLLWLLPFGVFLTGIYQPLSYWAIRCDNYGLLSRTKVSQTLLGLATNLLSSPLGSIGLILGQIVSRSAGFLTIYNTYSETLRERCLINRHSLYRVLSKYSHFGFYSSPAGLLNVVGNQLPNLIFASAYGSMQLGQLAFAQRLLTLPAAFVSQPVGKVFLGEAPKHLSKDNLKSFYLKVCKKLLKSSLLLIIPYAILLYFTATFIFGKQWEELPTIILLFVPLSITSVVTSPVSNVFVVIQQNQKGLINQSINFALKIVPLICLVSHLSFTDAVMLFVVCRIVAYLLVQRSAIVTLSKLNQS